VDGEDVEDETGAVDVDGEDVEDEAGADAEDETGADAEDETGAADVDVDAEDESSADVALFFCTVCALMNKLVSFALLCAAFCFSSLMTSSYSLDLDFISFHNFVDPACYAFLDTWG